MAKVAMIVGPGFEDSEFRVPYQRLRDVGIHVEILGHAEGEIIEGTSKQERIRIDRMVSDCDPQSYQGLVVSGGRLEGDMIDFVESFVRTRRPIASVGHGRELDALLARLQ